jgi:hemoglobin
MERAHFDRWLELFRNTVDRLFAGPNAEEAKLRALSIATVMLVKVQQS